MSAPGPELMVEMYAAMLRVRLFEERARELFQRGRIPGFLHTSVGQEAVAVGVAAALRTDDYVLSTHRGHGHLVAKGGSLRGLMAELYGKANGICHGKGGTMHIADVSVGYLGANGVLASGSRARISSAVNPSQRPIAISRRPGTCVGVSPCGAPMISPLRRARTRSLV